jgi:cysteinyl-tRNA synthetase
VHELLKQHPGEVLRYLLISAHYRQPLDWSEQELERARKTLDRLYSVLRTAADRFGPLEPDERPGEAFLEALRDDLNTPVAIAEFNRVARDLAKAETAAEACRAAGELLADAALIGLLQTAPDAWFGALSEHPENVRIEQLIARRNTARSERDFKTADAIRDELTALGVVLEDGDGVTRWRRADS